MRTLITCALALLWFVFIMLFVGAVGFCLVGKIKFNDLLLAAVFGTVFWTKGKELYDTLIK